MLKQRKRAKGLFVANIEVGKNQDFCKFVLSDEFIWEIWLISETWLDCSKLTYNTCNSTNKGSKNWSITFKGHKAVLLKAILAKTSNFWPIGPIELKFWHLVLKMIHFNISLRQSHGSSFRPLWWLLLGPQRSKKVKNWRGTKFWANISII